MNGQKAEEGIIPLLRTVTRSGLSLQSLLQLKSQSGIWLPRTVMVQKGFASVSVALSRPGLENSTYSRAQVELKAQVSSAFESLLDSASLRSDRSCWVVTSCGERGQKNILQRKGYNSSLLVANL